MAPRVKRAKWALPEPMGLTEAEEMEILELAGRVILDRVRRRVRVSTLPLVGDIVLDVRSNEMYFDRPLADRRLLFKLKLELNANTRRNFTNQLSVPACPHAYSHHSIRMAMYAKTNRPAPDYMRQYRKGDTHDYLMPCCHPDGAGHSGACLDYYGKPLAEEHRLSAAQVQSRIRHALDWRQERLDAAAESRSPEYVPPADTSDPVDRQMDDQEYAKKAAAPRVRKVAEPKNVRESMKRTLGRLEVD